MKCSVDPNLCWAILRLFTEIYIVHTAGAAIPCTFMTTDCAIYWFLRQLPKSLLLHERGVASQTANVKFPYDQGMALTVQLLASLLASPNATDVWCAHVWNEQDHILVPPCSSVSVKVLVRKFPYTNQGLMQWMHTSVFRVAIKVPLECDLISQTIFWVIIRKSSYRANKSYWRPIMPALIVRRQRLQQQRWQFRLQIEFEVNCTFVCINSWSTDVCVCVFMYTQFSNWLCMYV